MITITILSVLLMISFIINGITIYGARELTKKVNKSPKELTTTPKAICDCDHPLSMHSDEDGCHAKLVRVQGQLMKNSFTCPCVKYVGPVPISQYFDDQLKELG